MRPDSLRWHPAHGAIDGAERAATWRGIEIRRAGQSANTKYWIAGYSTHKTKTVEQAKRWAEELHKVLG